ncbi:hyaluronidase-1-like [Argonauta hians]
MKEKYDVISSISVKNFSGPAVIDWESWRPLFERNFDTKSIYKNRSKRLVKQQHPSWNTTRILREAKIQFETAARNLMVSSLELGEQLRSNGRWGFYGFPRIYRKNMTRTRMNNDRLRWLFSLSSGLYPSIYLKSEKDSWLKKYNYVVQTLDEVFRVFNKFSQENKTLVIPYTRFRYQKPEEIFYTKNELMLSLAIPATKGSAGAILWDSSFDFRNRKHCQMMNGYLTTTLGPFAKNLTNTFKFCSESLCNGNGRCVKTVWNTVASRRRGELGVNMIKMSYNINSKKQLVKHIEKVLSSSNHSLKRNLKTIFSCKCYAEWKGKRCQFHRNSFNITIG